MQTKDAKKEKRGAKAIAAEENVAQLIFPSKPTSTNANMEKYALNVNLFAIMQGKNDGTEDVTNCSPLKKKTKNLPQRCQGLPPQQSML
jgi:hypothetical protein